jgi:DNA-directed RNA polymerase subunit RPC12/RpoP
MDESPAEPAQPPESSPAPQYICPNCGTSVDPATVSGPVIECPQCNTQFFPPAVEEPAETSAEEDALTEKTREEQLSALHIKAAATLRRGAYRERSYYIVGLVASVVIMIQLVINATGRIHREHRLSAMTVGYLLFALALFIGAGKFGNLALEVHRRIRADIRARELEEMEAAKNPPDLSLLSDGSQHAKNLEKMFEDQGRP